MPRRNHASMYTSLQPRAAGPRAAGPRAATRSALGTGTHRRCTSASVTGTQNWTPAAVARARSVPARTHARMAWSLGHRASVA